MSINKWSGRRVRNVVNDTVLTRAQGTGAAVDFHHVVAVENSTSTVAQHLRVQAVDLATTPPEVATTRRDVFVAQTPEAFVHDADGNLTEDGRWRYTWDAENRLVVMETKPSAAVSVGLPRQRLEFAYDDSARRIMKRVLTWNEAITSYEWTRETRFLWDGWTLLAELDATAQGALTPKAAYTWGREFADGAGDGARQLVQVQRLTGAAPGTYAPIYGHNYNLAGYVALATGEHAAAYDYGAFGESVSVRGTLPREFSFRFSTKFSDDETGLSYFGFRYLNTGTGRWPSRDPIEEQGGVNLYGMVNNNPVDKWDLLGLACQTGATQCPTNKSKGNGCGSSGWKGRLVPNKPLWMIDFSGPCNQHDIGYSTCGKSKESTDGEFLGNMLDECYFSYGSNTIEFPSNPVIEKLKELDPRRIRLRICNDFARTYHVAVVKLGATPYADAQKESCKCCCPEEKSK